MARSGNGSRRLDDCLAGGGDMGSRMRAFDWSQTALGPVETWPQSLKTAVRIMLNSRYAMWMAWGPELTFFYNDAYAPTLGVKQQWALGSRSDKVWEEIWPEIGPRIETVLRTGTATWDERLLLFLERSGYLEETYHTFSYSPLANDSGAITGMLCVVTEDTERVLAERRLETLRELGAQATLVKSAGEACHIAVATCGKNLMDIPFALLYTKGNDGNLAELHGSSLLEKGGIASPAAIDWESEAEGGWPLGEAIRTGLPVHVADVRARFGDLPAGVWNLPPEEALVLPIRESESRTSGALVVGVSPCRKLDDRYRTFFSMVAHQIATTIASARAYEDEANRAEALAELDRAKTVFFSNVSHEFRTPLTLLLGPVEDALARSSDAEQKDQLELAHRNALRLQKLVNILLDFSRIEAGRIQAAYEPTDLAAFTAELASVFRSAIERAGMRLLINCQPLSEPAYVDRDMWEKVVLNLVSNAFKFTLQGEIEVLLRQAGGDAILAVRDTGTGIPQDQLPYIFERFHRIEGTQARTHEGTGIGLALVEELVKLHGGMVGVDSALGEGTTFTIRIPLGVAHLPPDRIGSPRTSASTALRPDHYVEEALRWIPADDRGSGAVEASVLGDAGDLWGARRDQPGSVPRARILIADDNADLREHLARLLLPRYDVSAVADGEAALAAAKATTPDLVVTDVMMPKLDGFGLLKELRSDPRTRTTPVIMLSARAGEESRVEGLESGADDYLIKPFSSRELLARISSQLELARVRREAADALQESERRFRALVTATSEVIYRMSPDWAEMRQLEGREILADTYEPSPTWLERYIHPDDRAAVHAVIKEAIRNKSIFEREHRILRLDGTWGWTFSRAIPVVDAQGEIVEWFGAASDVTRRKQAEAERERLLKETQQAKQEAETANRMKDEFLATLSHELRTPLNAILGWAKILGSGRIDDDDLHEGVEVIERNSKAQAQLIDDLLDISRIISGKMALDVQRVNLHEVIDAAVAAILPAAEAKGVRLQKVLDSLAGPVAGDATRIQQIVWNLLANAVKFTPSGGKIHLLLERVNSHVEISVIDTGIGISPDFLPFVFDRFRQADGSTTRRHGGLGLGLAIVKQLTEMHGGGVRAKSPGEGQGSTFTVCLPIATVHPERVPPKPPEGKEEICEQGILAGIRVLVVDDEQDARQLIKRILEECRADVSVAASATEAFELIMNSAPDVLLSDIGMPDRDGYDLIRDIRDRWNSRELPAAALTAFARSDDRRRAMFAGFQTHVSKPVDPDELVAVVASLAGRTRRR